jgi:SAM-dependent methyltransferase
MLLSQYEQWGIKQEERRWQDRQGGALQQRAYERGGVRVVLHAQFACVAEALRLEPGMRLLDLGCGVGYFLAWLVGRGPAEYHGLDLSLNSLSSARKMNPIVELVVGDAESLPYKDGSFDRITCNGAAHHFLDVRAAFRELYRVLVPGGILVMYEPTVTVVTSMVRALFLRSNEYESPADLAHKEEFTASRARASLLEVGFTDISTSLHDFLAYPLSGHYMGSPLSRLHRVMELLCRLESRLKHFAILRRMRDVFAWRLLVVATKPRL